VGFYLAEDEKNNLDIILVFSILQHGFWSVSKPLFTDI
jgi:hypothetical protein